MRERDRGALKRFSLLLACGLVLASGFVYAGGQHFAALKLGYQTEKLRGSFLSTEKNGGHVALLGGLSSEENAVNR